MSGRTGFSVLSTDQIDQIVELYALDWSLERLGRKFHCHRKTVRRALISRKVEIRARGGHPFKERITHTECERVLFAYHTLGLGYRTCGALLGMHPDRVRYIVERHSTPRTQSEAARLRYAREPV